MIIVEIDETLLAERLDHIEQTLASIVTQEDQIVSDIDTLTADFNQYKADVTAAVAELKDELAAALANQGGVPAEVQAKLDALDAAIVAADTEVKPADTEPPADGTGDSSGDEPPADQPAA